MRSSILFLAFTATAAAAAFPAAAATRTLTLDPSESEVTFHLGATGHDVEGRFHLRSGNIEFDPTTGAASGEIVVEATGAETGSKKRDKTMHRKVLESETYPLFRFSAESLSGKLAETGPSEFELQGTLSIHGSDHPFTLPVTADIEGDRVTASSSFPVPYVDWGLHDPSFLMLRVEKVVDVNVSIVGTLATSGTERAGRLVSGR